MTLLVVAPDYASHVLPLLALAGAWRDQGERVVVATGPATAALVGAEGFERAELILGRGSNPGIIRPEAQPAGEDDNLRAFFAATRQGPLATLHLQAEARADDLLWEPVERGRKVLDVVERVQPDDVLVDHVAFTATLALRAAGVPYGDVVLGHPTAMPVGDEIYGVPPTWPACFDVDAAALAALRQRCIEVRDAFTARCNEAATSLVPGAEEVSDAFAAHGTSVLLAYPEPLHDRTRTEQLPPRTELLGWCGRHEELPADVAAWVDAGRGPLVHVSFGSFLSARDDVLAKVVAALASLDVRVSLATGSAERRALGVVPESWLVRPYLPQAALLERADAIVTHGGNNSVTEALSNGVPLVVLPFSTDQFAGAAAVERAGCGVALAPNDVSSAELTAAVEQVLHGPATARAAAIAEALRADPGPRRAHRAMAAQRSRPGASPSR